MQCCAILLYTRSLERKTHLLRGVFMEWKDLEKMTVVKLREEALKFPQIEAVHGKNKSKLMDELAGILGIESRMPTSAKTLFTRSPI